MLQAPLSSTTRLLFLVVAGLYWLVALPELILVPGLVVVESMRPIRHATALHQRWSMFSGGPREVHHLEIRGLDARGEVAWSWSLPDHSASGWLESWTTYRIREFEERAVNQADAWLRDSDPLYRDIAHYAQRERSEAAALQAFVCARPIPRPGAPIPPDRSVNGWLRDRSLRRCTLVWSEP